MCDVYILHNEKLESKSDLLPVLKQSANVYCMQLKSSMCFHVHTSGHLQHFTEQLKFSLLYKYLYKWFECMMQKRHICTIHMTASTPHGRTNLKLKGSHAE